MDNKDLLHQADALMNRWREPSGQSMGQPTDQPLAPASVESSSELIAETPPTADNEEDIPVLTEAVTDVYSPPLTPDVHDTYAAQQQALKEGLDQWLDQWLDHTLPDVVLRVLDGLADQLIGQISDQVRQELLPKLKDALRPPLSKPDPSNQD